MNIETNRPCVLDRIHKKLGKGIFVGDEQIEIAIAVIIGAGYARAVTLIVRRLLPENRNKPASLIVAVEPVWADFGDKQIFEVGPGIIRHLGYIKNMPIKYTVCDINEDILDVAEKQLQTAQIPCDTILLARERSSELPFADESFDIVISFNSLEHLYPLENYLIETKRILKKGGHLVGGIPCEGGLAWGLGRYLTTRRYVHKNYGINYDKIICWEHPNFVDFIIEQLDTHFQKSYLKFHPFSFLPIDFNLIASFIYIRN